MVARTTSGLPASALASSSSRSMARASDPSGVPNTSSSWSRTRRTAPSAASWASQKFVPEGAQIAGGARAARVWRRGLAADRRP